MRSTRYIAEESAIAGNEATLASLWAQNLPDYTAALAQAKLQRSYLGNPAGPGACVLLQEQASAQTVGVQCLHARVFWRGSQPLHAAGMADYVVGQAHRSLGPALTLMRRCIAVGKSRFDFVYGFPNSKSEPVCTRAGMVRVGGATRYAKLLSSGLLLRQRVPKPLQPWLAAPADLLLRAFDAVRQRRHANACSWRAVRADDPGLAQLWERRPAELLLSERSPAVLAWRYPARAGWQLSLASDADGQPCGYVAWRSVGHDVLISDFFCADPDRDTHRLLAGFCHVARRERAHAVFLEFYGRPQITGALRRAGFVPRPARTPIFLAHGEETAWEDAASLYITAFDRDDD
ncbi:hypothetical protein [Caldimonas brevitalea]|uniref:Uncharacterized protein n=1 Tax=Caldimonas brevitalea TaxID=413882 RepID=A0A0G3BNY7_9BURK|nr:hypothetical protein [Caldimonas brevitalea]AKJ31117.1 hypothetical protein AAW51_4426 [Caldimonas brevitalea]